MINWLILQYYCVVFIMLETDSYCDNCHSCISFKPYWPQMHFCGTAFPESNVMQNHLVPTLTLRSASCVLYWSIVCLKNINTHRHFSRGAKALVKSVNLCNFLLIWLKYIDIQLFQRHIWRIVTLSVKSVGCRQENGLFGA